MAFAAGGMGAAGGVSNGTTTSELSVQQSVASLSSLWTPIAGTRASPRRG